MEVKTGEEVRWVNSTGGNTNEYTVHGPGTKVHAHRGTVVVK